MPMDYPAIDFDEQGQLLIARGNFIFFRKIPYIINQKKKKSNCYAHIPILVTCNWHCSISLFSLFCVLKAQIFV